VGEVRHSLLTAPGQFVVGVEFCREPDSEPYRAWVQGLRVPRK
jgi:hypothetical protein